MTRQPLKEGNPMDTEKSSYGEQLSIVAEISLRPSPTQAQDFLGTLDALHRLGSVTLEHAASSYGQPIILDEDGRPLDYIAVAGVHLLEVGTVVGWHQRSQQEGYTGRLGCGVPTPLWRQVAKSLAVFGIRVTRISLE